MATKTCVICGSPFDTPRGKVNTCSPDCHLQRRRQMEKARATRWHEEHREEWNAQRRSWASEYRKAHADTVYSHGARYRRKLRREVLEAYGGLRCTCDHGGAPCGVSQEEFLSLDHINGKKPDGAPRGGHALHLWLKRHGFPSGFRVLCHNCNQALGMYGYCPCSNTEAQNVVKRSRVHCTPPHAIPAPGPVGGYLGDKRGPKKRGKKT